MLFPDLTPDITAHVLREYPREAVGVIYRDGENTLYKPCNNIHPEPEKHFLVSGRITAPLMRDNRLLGVIHSHTNGVYHPSSDDMRSQISVNVPYGLVLTDGETVTKSVWWGDPESVPPPPLLGREFMSGVADCYSIVRDHYWIELGIKLPDFARDPNWWETGQTLYVDGVRGAGFRPSHLDRIKRHDVVLMSIFSDTADHAAVYLGSDQEGGGDRIVHHLGHRLSHDADPLGKWRKHIHSVWRHESLCEV